MADKKVSQFAIAANLDDAVLAGYVTGDTTNNWQFTISLFDARYYQQGAGFPASATTSGTFDNARISQSSVVQHVGSLSHSSLLPSSLGNDDHTIYHTDARGDARYYTQAQVDSLLSGVGGGGSVASIFGRTGVVTAQPGDYTAAQITETVSAKIMTLDERSKLDLIEDGATADQTPAEIVAATNYYLGQTDWQLGGGGSGATSVLWASKVESVDVPGGGFKEVVLTATGATPTGHVTDLIEIPTTDADVSAWARITANDTITIRVSTIGPAITISGTWKVSWVAKTSYSWFSHTVNETVAGSDFTTVTVPALGVANATHVVKFIYLPTTSAKLKAWSVVGTDEVTVRAENTDAPGVLLDGDVEVVVQLKSAAFPESVPGTGNTTTVADYTALIASTEQTKLVYMKCYSNTDDGGGGWFEARESGATIDYGHVVGHGSGGAWRYHRLGVNKGVANVCHFGAQGSGDVAHRTANTTAFQRAIDYLSTVSATDYNGGYALIVPKGAGEYYIDGEVTIPTTVAELHILGIGRVTICQYTDGTGIFVFTKNQTDTPTSLHRFVLIRDITFSWFSFQQLADFRSNAVMLTNAPDGSAGHTFGFTFEQCKFERGRCGFTLIKTGDASWTDAETDAWVAGGFVQTVCFDKCSFYYMSGGAYYVSDTSAGGPQLLFRNINSTHGYTSGGRVKILEREFIYVNHAQIVTIDDLEFLMADRALIYCGNSHNVKLTQIAFEFYNMADQSQAMRFNGGDTFFTVDGIRIQNSTFPADRWIVATYQATGRVMGSCLAYNNTSTTGRLYFCGRYAGSTGTIGWDANAKYTANNATCAAADNSNVTTWAPSAITNT